MAMRGGVQSGQPANEMRMWGKSGPSRLSKHFRREEEAVNVYARSAEPAEHQPSAAKTKPKIDNERTKGRLNCCCKQHKTRVNHSGYVIKGKTAHNAL
jgi:hypothetical protein